MKLSPLAGKPAPASVLVDIPRLLTAYYTGQPDASIAGQRVAFGTSGHRGSSLDLSFNENHVVAISQAIVKRPFVVVGFAAFAIMALLAATSCHAAVRWLGGRKWQELHRSIYLIAILASGHVLWQSKAAELPVALTYAILVAILLYWRIRERKRKARPPVPSSKVQPLRFHKKKPD